MDFRPFLTTPARGSQIFGEAFPDVENGVPQTIDDLKVSARPPRSALADVAATQQVIIDTLVRQRDTRDLQRPCASCKALVPKPRCSARASVW